MNHIKEISSFNFTFTYLDIHTQKAMINKYGKTS